MQVLRQLVVGLWLQRQRSFLAVLSVAAAVMLVVVLEGFKVGLYQQIRAYPHSLQVPLIATQAGVSNMTGARSIIPLATMSEVRAVDGVAEVHPLVGVPLVYGQGSNKTPIYLVAFAGKGGPASIARGRRIEKSREIVIDRGLAAKYDLAPGDTFSIAGFPFSIAGLSGGSSNMFNPFVFIRIHDALALYSAAPKHLTRGKVGVSFLLIETKGGVDIGSVRAGLEAAVPAIDVLTPSELAANDARMAAHLMGGVMMLLISVAYVVGVLVIGLTLYSSVHERLRQFGVMKALGSPNRRLYSMVAFETAVVVAFSIVIGVLASIGVAKLVGMAAPQYLVVPWDAGVLARTTVAVFGMASIAALIPIRQVANADPLMVFRR